MKKCFKLEYDDFYRVLVRIVFNNCKICRKYLCRVNDIQIKKVKNTISLLHNKTLFLRLSKSKISLIGKRMDKIYFAQNCIRPAKDLIDKRLEFKNLENQLTHEKVVCFCPMIDTLKTDLFSLDIMKNFYYSILIRNH